jgi:hypothetical protein
VEDLGPTPPGEALGYTHTLSYSCRVIGVLLKPNYSTFVASDNRYIYQNGTNDISYAICSPDSKVGDIPAWGLVTYDQTGQLVFSSNINYLKIRTIIDVPWSYLSDGVSSYNISHANVSDPYYLIPLNWGYEGCLVDPSNHSWVRSFKMIGVKKLSSTSAQIGWFRIWGQFNMSDCPYDHPVNYNVPNPFRVAVCEV